MRILIAAIVGALTACAPAEPQGAQEKAVAKFNECINDKPKPLSGASVASCMERAWDMSEWKDQPLKEDEPLEEDVL